MAGIAFLRRLLMKQAMKKSAGSSGIMSLNKNLVNDVDITVKKWIDSAKKQGQDIDKMGEQEIKYIVELNKPKAPRTLQELMDKIGLNDPKKNRFLQKEGEVLDLTGKKIDTSKPVLSGKNVPEDIVTDTITKIKSMEPMDAMKEANLVIARKGKYKNLTIDESQDILKKTDDHIFERDIKYDEFGEIIKPDPEDLAHGGRTGYKEGFKVYPKISASKSNMPLGDGYNVDLQDLLYGGTMAYEKGPFSGGIEYLKGKNKYDFRDREDTLQKDTSDSELLSLILKMELDSGLKARLKGDKDNVRFDISKSFAQGGRTGSGLNYLLGEDDQNSRVPYSKGSRKRSWTDRIAGWTGGKNVMAGEIGLETWDLLNNLLQSGGLYAEGGRIGLGLGGISKARRAFLKIMGAGAAGVGIAKSGLFSLLKGGGKKAVIKDLTSIPIKNPPGMPVWFKPLVNKVIKEGDDVTKKFATADREIVHQVSLEGKIGKDSLGVNDVRVTQNLDEGTISVQYNSPDTIGESGVELIYKKGEEIPIKKKGKSTSVTEKDEFTAVEDDFYPQTTSPDGDFDIEFTENVVNKIDDLYSDTSKLKEFATGKKLTIKEISESIKKKNILKEIDKNPNEHAFRNVPEYDGPYEDFASGGRVPLVEGGTPSSEELENYYRELEKQKERRRIQKEIYEQRFGGPGPILEAASGGLAGLLGE